MGDVFLDKAEFLSADTLRIVKVKGIGQGHAGHAMACPVVGTVKLLGHLCLHKTRPDTRLPKSHAGGQGPYLRSLDHLGRSGEVQKIKNHEKSKV